MVDMNRKARKKARKKRRLRKMRVAILFFVLAILCVGGYMVFDTYHAINKSYDDLGREKSDLRETVVSIGKDPISILILGIEDYSTGGKNGRTDALMVATFNPDDGRVKLLSIPRDTLVEIDNEGTLAKINAAHVFGGVEGTINTVEKFLEIPIDYYASVDFDGFVNIIDILGGVEVDVPFDFSQDSLDGEMHYFYEGPMELNGKEALAFVRMRKQDRLGDIGRNQRQQQVVKGVVEKALSLGTITKIGDIADEIGENVQTNLRITDGVALLDKFPNFSNNSIDTVVLKTYPDRYKGASVQIADDESLEEVQMILKEHLGLMDASSMYTNTTNYE